jgi:hypothetical protein
MSFAHHEEDKLAAHLDTLNNQQLANINAHADIANDDKHPHQEKSANELARLAAGLLGVPVTIGLGFKFAKFLRRFR